MLEIQICALLDVLHCEQPLDGFLRDTEVIVLGTTVVTNALLQYAGARVGVITTAGFRDMLDLRRNYRESLFDIRLQPPRFPLRLASPYRRRRREAGDYDRLKSGRTRPNVHKIDKPALDIDMR